MTDNADYRAAIEGAVLFDLSDRGKIELRGPDARSFLHNLCTQDVKNLPAGAGREAFLTTMKARVVAHMWMSNFEGGLLLDMARGRTEKVRSHLDHYLISEQVEILDLTADLAFFRLCGPRSSEFLDPACRQLEPLASCRISWPGVGPVDVRRQTLVALPGYDLICSSASAAPLREALTQAGVRSAGPSTYETLRIEAGLPEFGPDIDEDRLAMETGRTAQAICYTKGCYLGQETIVMARDRGQVNRQLLGVQLVEGTSMPAGTKLFHGTEEAGHVTSSVFSPRLNRIVGLAYLRRGCQAPGMRLSTDPTSAAGWVTVASLPLVTGASPIT
jgi:folate-binding protein YgfZ